MNNMDLAPLPLLIALGACSTPFDDPELPGSDSGQPLDDPDELLTSLDGSGCEDFDGTPLSGAATYFYGQYVPDGDGYDGEERWIILSNETLEAAGQADCEVVWSTRAEIADPGACGACDQGLSVSASLDPSSTTCPEGFYTNEETFAVTYGLIQQGDEDLSWYFAGSGQHMADGTYAGGVLTFLTDKSCAWF
jgi:hypothetical protein